MITKHTRFCLFLVALLFNNIKSLFLIIDPRENRCISREMKEKEYFGGFYVISGEDESDSRVYITNQENNKLWELENQKNGSFQMGINADGAYSLCVENKSDKQVIFSFEFSEDKHEEQVLSVRKFC